MAFLFENNAKSTLAAGINDSATSLSVQSGDGTLFPNPSSPDEFRCVIFDTAGNWEIIKVTTRATDSLSVIVRAQEGTSARAWLSGDNISNRVTRDALTGSSQQILIVQDEKTTGTDGGASTATTWETRVLNTVKTNTISGASLSSNQITLAAGTYDVLAFSPVQGIDEGHAVLYNTSDASYEIIGDAGDASSFYGYVYTVMGRFTIAAEKTFEIRQYTTSINPIGLGSASSSGQTEVYTQVRIEKVA